MEGAKNLVLITLLALFSGGMIYMGCGDYEYPDGASEVENTGFIIFTNEQGVFNGDSSFDVCPKVCEGGTFVAFSYQDWDESKEVWAEFLFEFVPNYAFDDEISPPYAVVDECALSIPDLNYEEERGACGPWEINMEGGDRVELTIISNVWGYGWLEYYNVTMGAPYGSSFSYTAYMTIWAKAIDGTEQEAETYAIISVFPEIDSCKDKGSPPPSWTGADTSTTCP